MSQSRYEIALAFKDMFSSSARKFQRETESIGKSIGSSRRALAGLKADSRALTHFDRLSSRLEVTQSRLSAARAEVEHYAEEVRKSGGENRDSVLALARAEAAAKKLSLAHRQETNQLDALRARLRGAGHDLSDVSAAQRRLSSSIELASSSLDGQTSRLKKLKQAESGLKERRVAAAEEFKGVKTRGMQAGAAIAPAAYFAVDFETAFLDVKKSAGDATESELARLKSKILREAGALGMTPSQLAGMVADIGKNGVAKDKLFDYAKFGAQMTTAFEMPDPAESINSLMRWRSGMGLDLEGLKNLGDTINHVADNMSTTPVRLSEILTRQGSTLKGSGFSPGEIVALAGAIDSASPAAEMSATAMKNLSVALVNGDSVSGGQKSVLSRLGYDPKQLAVDMQRDAAGTVLGVFRSFKSLSKETRMAAISDFFGVESIGAIAPLLENLDNLEKSFGLLNDEGIEGSMGEEFAQKIETASFKIDQLKSSFQAMSVTIGDHLLPNIKQALDGTTQFFGAVRDFAAESKAASGIIVGSLAAFVTAPVALKAASKLRSKASDDEVKQKIRESRIVRLVSRAADRATSSLRRFGAALNDADGSSRSRRSRGRRGGRLSGLSDMGSRVAGKVVRPLGAATAASGLIVAANAGDFEDVAETSGEIIGGVAGAAAGAAGGAAVGSIVPGLGTAIGGAVGAVAGGIAGELSGGWVGEQIGNLFDDENPKVQQKTVNFSPVNNITINPSGNVESDLKLKEQVEALLKERDDAMLGQLIYRYGDA